MCPKNVGALHMRAQYTQQNTVVEEDDFFPEGVETEEVPYFLDNKMHSPPNLGGMGVCI